MPVYITDTYALIWRLVAPERLAARAGDAFDQADAGQAEICIPAVVLAERVMVAEKGRVPGWRLDEVRRFVRAVKALDQLSPVDVDARTGDGRVRSASDT